MSIARHGTARTYGLHPLATINDCSLLEQDTRTLQPPGITCNLPVHDASGESKRYSCPGCCAVAIAAIACKIPEAQPLLFAVLCVCKRTAQGLGLQSMEHGRPVQAGPNRGAGTREAQQMNATTALNDAWQEAQNSIHELRRAIVQAREASAAKQLIVSPKLCTVRFGHAAPAAATPAAAVSGRCQCGCQCAHQCACTTFSCPFS